MPSAPQGVFVRSELASEKGHFIVDRSSQILAYAFAACLVATIGYSQRPPIHYFHSGNLPPGTVGDGQLLRHASMRGYSQPVEIRVPQGAKVSFQVDGQFDPPQAGPALAGMQVGGVYQLKITSIPFQVGHEVFPTVEIINRLHPPPGQHLRFPIPIDLTQEEIEMALSGQFVTRVIYLEDRERALAHADDVRRQRYFDVGPKEDPLLAADRLGRPMAILRMGSRVPDLDAGEAGLGYGRAPLIRYSHEEREAQERNSQPAIERETRHYPRTPIPGQPRTPTTLPAGLIVP